MGQGKEGGGRIQTSTPSRKQPHAQFKFALVDTSVYTIKTVDKSANPCGTLFNGGNR